MVIEDCKFLVVLVDDMNHKVFADYIADSMSDVRMICADAQTYYADDVIYSVHVFKLLEV